MPAKAVHVVVHGRVQGVGFRAFVEQQAAIHDLGGWVRNISDGSVEAVLSGETDAVDAAVTACRTGPRGARVTEVTVTAAGIVDGEFEVRPTA